MLQLKFQCCRRFRVKLAILHLYFQHGLLPVRALTKFGNGIFVIFRELLILHSPWIMYEKYIFVQWVYFCKKSLLLSFKKIEMCYFLLSPMTFEFLYIFFVSWEKLLPMTFQYYIFMFQLLYCLLWINYLFLNSLVFVFPIWKFHWNIL